MIPDEAVEAAAKAAYEVQPVELFGEDGPVTWEQLSGSIIGNSRKWHEIERAKRALEAAAPHMQRETVTEWAAAFPTTGNAYNYHRTREEAQAFVDAMKEDGVDMIVMTREVLPAEASEWKPTNV